MNMNKRSSKKSVIIGIGIALLGFAVLMNLDSAKNPLPKNPTAKDFKAGECLSYIGGDYVYQVVEVGDHSLRVAKRLTDSVEDTMIFENDIQNKIQKADCFDLFKTGLPVK